jgi:hypothetical protein
MRKLNSLLILAAIFCSISCLNRQYEDGWMNKGLVSDTSINDSALIYGHISNATLQDNQVYFANEYTVWIDGTDHRTTNDTDGNYFFKLMPGTYTVKCESSGNPWERLIEEIRDLKVEANTKTKVDFYIGTTIE